ERAPEDDVAMAGQEFAQDGVVLEGGSVPRVVDHQGESSLRGGGIADAGRGYVEQVINEVFSPIRRFLARFGRKLCCVLPPFVVRQRLRESSQRRVGRPDLQVVPVPPGLGAVGRLSGITDVNEDGTWCFARRVVRRATKGHVVPARVVQLPNGPEADCMGARGQFPPERRRLGVGRTSPRQGEQGREGQRTNRRNAIGHTSVSVCFGGLKDPCYKPVPV